jgi:hypothetical protein
MDAVKLEMTNVPVAFKVYNGNTDDLIGYQKISGHLVFDCADGHKTTSPASVTYSTVVSQDSVRIILTITALNDYKKSSAPTSKMPSSLHPIRKKYGYKPESNSEQTRPRTY